MCRILKKLSKYFCIAALALAWASSASGSDTVTDLAGRQVTLRSPVRRAVALAGPSYEKAFLLGQADRLIGMHWIMAKRPWVIATNPSVASAIPIESPAEPNIEGLLAMEADCVFFWSYAEPLAAMTNAGLPVVVVQNATGNPKTVEEFIEYQKREVRVFADVFGEEAKAKADDWFNYFDERVAYVRSRVGDIADVDRKTAVYAYGEEGLGVFSRYSYVSFWLELAGGRNAADATGQEMDAVVTMEQMIAWDPDYIFMGRMDSREPVTKNPKWAGMSALKAGRVYLCPDGVMYWDYSSEGVLLMQYLAKKMYPERFADLDIVAETQAYYKRFYNYDLGFSDAVRLLEHLPPAK